MNFYVILRRETGSYVADGHHGEVDTDFISLAKRYVSHKLAMEAMGPNTCVCGPYPTDDYGGQPK